MNMQGMDKHETEKQGMDRFVAGGLAALERMEQASLRGPQISLETLMRVIRENEDTEYGVKYDFRNIHSYADYAAKVPFSDYEDYEPYIERMVCFGAKNLITSSDVRYFAHTSGTSGASKMIPRTQEELDILYNDIFLRAFGLCEKERLAGRETSTGNETPAAADFAAGSGGGMPRRKGVNFMESQIGYTPVGIAHGAISETLNHPEDTALCSALPEEIIYSSANFDRRHIKLLFALRERNLSYLMATFSPMISDMVIYLQNHWQDLCDDLEAGRIGDGISVDHRLRARLDAMLTPDPARADEIRRIMEERGDGDFISGIWPDLCLSACVGTASFAPHMEKIRKHIGPGIAVDYLGYVTSESTVAAQIKEGEEAFMLLPYSGFYEFIPVDGDSQEEVPVLMDRLEAGREYELVITNLSGLYRYRIGDVIRVAGFHNNCPMISFSYRKNQLVSMYGEKVTESVMQSVVETISEESGTNILEYSVYPDTDSQPGRYVMILESDEEIRPERWSYYSDLLNEKLCAAHSSYRNKVEQKTMRPLEVRFVQPQTYALYRDIKIMDGASPNQIKPLHVINNDKLKRFFFALLQG